jgi:hypothetical protein
MGKKTRDPRYRAVQSLIVHDQITTLSEIFSFLPKSVVSNDLGQNYATFLNRIAEPDGFTVGDIKKIAALIGIEEGKLFQLLLKGNSK